MRNPQPDQSDDRKDRGGLVQSCYPRPPSGYGIVRIVSVLSLVRNPVVPFAQGSRRREDFLATVGRIAYLEKVGALLAVT